jgi:hypothetical protein
MRYFDIAKKNTKDEKWLEKIMKMPNETDWLEFKSEYKLYTAEGKIVEKKRDEFIKDILGLANGNCHTIRKNKYLIIGVDDSSFEMSTRVIHPIEYRLPSQSEIAQWISSACNPVVAGIECENLTYKNNTLFVITIPPTFDLHETIRVLDTPNGHFNKYSIFMRQDEHTVLASVHDGITIEQRKHLFRQEIANPPALQIGIVVGGFVAFIIGRANLKSLYQTITIPENYLLVLFTFLGAFFGGSIGWIIRQFTEVRYEWRYITAKQKMIIISLCIIMIIALVVTIK